VEGRGWILRAFEVTEVSVDSGEWRREVNRGLSKLLKRLLEGWEGVLRAFEITEESIDEGDRKNGDGELRAFTNR
jgi:hypothetical protein